MSYPLKLTLMSYQWTMSGRREPRACRRFAARRGAQYVGRGHRQYQVLPGRARFPARRSADAGPPWTAKPGPDHACPPVSSVSSGRPRTGTGGVAAWSGSRVPGAAHSRSEPDASRSGARRNDHRSTGSRASPAPAGPGGTEPPEKPCPRTWKARQRGGPGVTNGAATRPLAAARSAAFRRGYGATTCGFRLLAGPARSARRRPANSVPGQRFECVYSVVRNSPRLRFDQVRLGARQASSEVYSESIGLARHGWALR